jgi:hypothetical protein
MDYSVSIKIPRIGTIKKKILKIKKSKFKRGKTPKRKFQKKKILNSRRKMISDPVTGIPKN